MCLFLKTKGCTSLQKASYPLFTCPVTASSSCSQSVSAFRNGHCFRKKRNLIQVEEDNVKKQKQQKKKTHTSKILSLYFQTPNKHIQLHTQLSFIAK